MLLVSASVTRFASLLLLTCLPLVHDALTARRGMFYRDGLTSLVGGV